MLNYFIFSTTILYFSCIFVITAAPEINKGTLTKLGTRRECVNLTSTDSCGPDQTKFNEGECLCCYYDTEKHPTIGVGFNLDRGDAGQLMTNYSLNLKDVIQDCVDDSTKACLTRENADNLYMITNYPEAERCGKAFVPDMPPIVVAGLTDLAFNMGCQGLRKFKEMHDALTKHDWERAGAECRDSDWSREVGPKRTDSTCNCIAAVCPGCTQVNTSEAYWRGPEAAKLCTGLVDEALSHTHGSPTITPMPSSEPCSETITCDPARYNGILAVYYDSYLNRFSCYGTGIDYLNDANPSQCDAKKSGFFLDPDREPLKALICYNTG